MSRSSVCPECETSIEPANRREFIRVIGSAAVAAAALPGELLSRRLLAADNSNLKLNAKG